MDPDAPAGRHAGPPVGPSGDAGAIRIRPACEADFAGISALLEEADALHCAALPFLFREYEGPARSAEYLSGWIADEGATVLVADDPTRLLGVVFARVRDSPDTPMHVPKRFGFLDTLAVRTSARRRGIGRALMREAGAWMRANGAREVQLTVYAFNAGAIAFYESLGYSVLSQTMRRPL